MTFRVHRAGIDLSGWAVTSALVYAARDDIAALLTSDPQIQAPSPTISHTDHLFAAYPLPPSSPPRH